MRNVGIYQPEDGQWKGPKYVVVLYVVDLYMSIPPYSCVRQVHKLLIYYEHNGDDEPYDYYHLFTYHIQILAKYIKA